MSEQTSSGFGRAGSGDVAERATTRYRPRRALETGDAEGTASHLHVAPRRALVERPSQAVIPQLTRSQLRNLQRARRGAPVRALLDRVLDGFEGNARRALIDPDELLAAELLRLTSLDPRWGFLQSVHNEARHTELDHWVIGPGGIFLLNAKHHPGSRLYVAGDNFLVDGKDEPYVPQMRGEASRGSEELSDTAHLELDVTGVIVPVNDRKLTIDQQPYQVEVIGNESVTEWLLNRPEELGRRQILQAFEAARTSRTKRPQL